MEKIIQNKICLECKKKFQTKWNFQKYCSNKCENNAWTKRVGYNKRPEVKERVKRWRKKHYVFHPRIRKEKIIKLRYCKLCNSQLNKTYNKSYCYDCKENNKEYFRNIQRQRCSKAAGIWYRKPGNREKVYAHLKRYRKEKNKFKWDSRKRTCDFYRRGKLPIGEKICKECGSKVYVQFHHEVYPSKLKEIEQAIKEEKIYFLCRKCHGKKRYKCL